MNTKTAVKVAGMALACLVFAAKAQNTWSVHKITTDSHLSDIACNGQHFVLVGQNGATFVSNDGFKWVDKKSSSLDLSYIEWGNGKFVCIANRYLPPQNCTTYFDMFGFHQVVTSIDGGNWKAVTKDTARTWGPLRWVGGRFVALECGFPLLWESKDGLLWEQRQIGGLCGGMDIVYRNGLYVVVGGYYLEPIGLGLCIHVQPMLFTSSDCKIWTDHTSMSRPALWAVTRGNNRFVAVGYPRGVYSSDNGVDWIGKTYSDISLWGVAWGNNAFVAVGDRGVILSSPDGTIWTKQESGTSAMLRRVLFAKNRFIAIGDSGTVCVSACSTAVCRAPMAGDGCRRGMVIEGNKLRYVIRSPSFVTIHLFDMKGRLVSRIRECRHTSGVFTADLPSCIPQGSYVLSFKTVAGDGDGNVRFITIVR